MGIADLKPAVEQHIVHSSDITASEIGEKLFKVGELIRAKIGHNLFKRQLNVVLLSGHQQLNGARQ